MADTIKDAGFDVVQLHGLMQGLNHLLNEGGEAMNGVYPLGDMIEQKLDQLCTDLDRIERNAKGGAA
ncbi:hypothetical protein [Antarcticimicrobium luteum]|uniref:Uncharacterized protein n=1 Tax=Antarcticimicrobium luteum TaxID=2547397 RepID=A0A4R5VBR7_9RHOB|nr:hypothetical protein [Antarcticimicrobium luteum]TDK49650.1 hypothetical protein E1832_08630 [Antarcticimicrobium luteum]